MGEIPQPFGEIPMPFGETNTGPSVIGDISTGPLRGVIPQPFGDIEMGP